MQKNTFFDFSNYCNFNLQVSQPELMRPVIKLTLPTLALFFAEKNLKTLGTS
jgi:hypothetical protein